MKREVSYLTMARRVIPWLILWVLVPLTTFVIYVGWGEEMAKEYWELVGTSA